MTVQLPMRADGLVALVVYLLGCLLVGAAGFIAKRKAHESSMEDHFLAGRAGLPAPVLLGTVSHLPTPLRRHARAHVQSCWAR